VFPAKHISNLAFLWETGVDPASRHLPALIDQLEVIKGPIAGARFPITQAQIEIGRFDIKNAIFPDVDLSAASSVPSAISRRHAMVQQRDGEIEIQDCGSRNGISVNGEALTSFCWHQLRDGDVVSLGGVDLTLRTRMPLTTERGTVTTVGHPSGQFPRSDNSKRGRIPLPRALLGLCVGAMIVVSLVFFSGIFRSPGDATCLPTQQGQKVSPTLKTTAELLKPC
jgi:pSer/pThr/pTyr-binding forkhead associated (FHA) protein